MMLVLQGKQPENYVFQAFPKYKYHKTKTSVVVNDENEEKSLGEGWLDAPFTKNTKKDPE